MPPALHAYVGCYARELAALELAAASPDVFRRGGTIAQFHRNTAVEVVGFSDSDSLMRGLRFVRRG